MLMDQLRLHTPCILLPSICAALHTIQHNKPSSAVSGHQSCRCCCCCCCCWWWFPAVFQILRGAEMVFAAFFAVTFLKRPLNRWHYGGVALCMVSTSTNGSVNSSGGSSSSMVHARRIS